MRKHIFRNDHFLTARPRQDPTLFSGTVKENILYGLELSAVGKEAQRSMEDVIEAAKSANAHDFITNLSQSYDTQVGK